MKQFSFWQYILQRIVKFSNIRKFWTVLLKKTVDRIEIPVPSEVLLIVPGDKPGVAVHELGCLQSGNYLLDGRELNSQISQLVSSVHLHEIQNLVFVLCTTLSKFSQPDLLSKTIKEKNSCMKFTVKKSTVDKAFPAFP